MLPIGWKRKSLTDLATVERGHFRSPGRLPARAERSGRDRTPGPRTRTGRTADDRPARPGPGEAVGSDGRRTGWIGPRIARWRLESVPDPRPLSRHPKDPRWIRRAKDQQSVGVKKIPM
jgi:hypothetical protein